jgi:hypothetical protein
MQQKRPTGVTILAILMIISGIASIIIGLGVLGSAFVLSLVAHDSNVGTVRQDAELGTLAGLLIGIGGFTIALGIASLVVAWGLLNGRGWAWIITIIISIVSIITSIVGIASGGIYHIITLIIYAVILYYLYKPEVKAYFGRIKVSK